MRTTGCDRYWADRMAANNVVPEMEIFEAGMVAASQMLIGEGAIEAPFYYNFALGAHRATPDEARQILGVFGY